MPPKKAKKAPLAAAADKAPLSASQSSFGEGFTTVVLPNKAGTETSTTSTSTTSTSSSTTPTMVVGKEGYYANTDQGSSDDEDATSDESDCDKDTTSTSNEGNKATSTSSATSSSKSSKSTSSSSTSSSSTTSSSTTDESGLLRSLPKIHEHALTNMGLTSNWFGPEVRVPSQWFHPGYFQGTYTYHLDSFLFSNDEYYTQ